MLIYNRSISVCCMFVSIVFTTVNYLTCVTGLCGTYDFNQKNDFKTKQGDIETNTNAFGNRWKTVPTCKDVALNASNDPCAENVNRRNQSAQYCDYLKGDLFSGEQ